MNSKTLSYLQIIVMRQLLNYLFLLFSKVSGSAQMMKTFSGNHKSQGFESHWYGKTFLWISHNRLLSRPCSFNFGTYFDKSVSFMH